MTVPRAKLLNLHNLITEIFTGSREDEKNNIPYKQVETIEEVFNCCEKTQNVIICGGTWFYIKSLLDKKALPESKIFVYEGTVRCLIGTKGNFLFAI